MSDNSAGNEGQQQNEKGGELNILKLFVRDASFEAPHAEEVFAQQNWAPEVEVQLHSEARRLPNGHYVIDLCER